jgi:hypothetical protein
LLKKTVLITAKKVIAGIKTDLSKNNFEELMTVKNKEYDIGVYIQEDDDIEGFFFIMDEDDSLIAVDLVGSMPVGDVGLLIEKMKASKRLLIWKQFSQRTA